MIFFKEALRQTLATMTVGFNEFSGGMSLGWTAPTLAALQKTDSTLPLTVDEFSWIVSTDNLGRIIGCLLSATFMDIIGRTPLLALSAITFSFTWLLLLTRSVFMICVMRMLLGIASGIQSGANCVYIGENSSPSIRGTFGTVCLALYHSGMFIEFIIASNLSYEATAIVNWGIQFCFLLGTLWLREPAQYLLTKGKEKRALQNFTWLRGASAPEDVLKEFELIKLNTQSEKRKKTSIKDLLTSKANYKSVTTMLIMYMLVGMIGYSAILACATVTFASSNIFTPNQFTILFGAIKVFFAIFASFMVNRFRRRALILTTFSLIAFVHACIALLYYSHENTDLQIVHFPWLIFTAVSVFAAIFAFAYPAIFMVRSELFPQSIRAFGSCISIIGYSLANFAVTKVFLLIYQNYGIHFNFIIFSISSSLMVIFVYLVLPETRNKSLIEIQAMLEK